VLPLGEERMHELIEAADTEIHQGGGIAIQNTTTSSP